MFAMVRFILNLFVFLLICAEMSLAADAPDNPLITRTPDGQVTLRSLRPSGGVADFLPYAPDEILVRFKDSTTPTTKTAVHGRFKANTIRRFRHFNGLELVKLPRGMQITGVIRAYRGNQNVLYAEPNYIVEHLGVPNDPSFPSQWNLQNTGQPPPTLDFGGIPGADIKAVPAWDITTGSNKVVVAVIDTGVDYNHQDLAANMWRNEADCNNNGIDDDGNGYIDDCYGINTFDDNSNPMDDNNHGTHVAGIIGAVGNNSLGVVGVNWNVKIMSCKFMGADGFGTIADAIGCLDYVKTMRDRGVNIIATNNSWGSFGYSQALFDAIELQRQRGILFIAAAGNGLVNNDVSPLYPASFYLPNVISVTASGSSDCITGNFSSRHGRRTVHLMAPGDSILSTTIGNTYSVFSGTSMATPHVTGVAGLLSSQNPARDWKALRNLILAGGEVGNCPYPGPDLSITAKRLSAHGALTCTNSTVRTRLRPIATKSLWEEEPVRWGLGRPLILSVLHINCAQPNGDVAVTVDPGGQTIMLRDDGLGSDQAAGDGVYTAAWNPPYGGLFTFTFPGDDVVTVDVDPHLKVGFPVKSLHLPGSFLADIHTLVGNIDEQPDQEIIVTALSIGPLYAWKRDGSLVAGWPLSDNVVGAGYPGLGELSKDSPGYEVVAGYFDFYDQIVAYSGTGQRLPGWPRESETFLGTPPAFLDVDGDGIDEVIIKEETGGIHAYRADGTPLPGWPTQPLSMPVIGDLDGDGIPDLVSAALIDCCTSWLYAFHTDGTLVSGFPVSFDGGAAGYFALGDVDGDGSPEIITVGWQGVAPGIHIFSATGDVKRFVPVPGFFDFGTAPALADLDGDGIPEIIVQTDEVLTAVRGDGTTFPGWPVLTGGSKAFSSPVVGDVDGDGLPDIVITTRPYRECCTIAGDVHAYNRNGTLLPFFPKRIPIGWGAVPAIADIDLNGRNDIIVSGSMWNGIAGEFDKVWVYEIDGPPHGAIQWGQFMEGPKHHGMYKGGYFVPHRSILNVKKLGKGSGVVSDSAEKPLNLICDRG